MGMEVEVGVEMGVEIGVKVAGEKWEGELMWEGELKCKSKWK